MSEANLSELIKNSAAGIDPKNQRPRDQTDDFIRCQCSNQASFPRDSYWTSNGNAVNRGSDRLTIRMRPYLK